MKRVFEKDRDDGQETKEWREGGREEMVLMRQKQKEKLREKEVIWRIGYRKMWLCTRLR